MKRLSIGIAAITLGASMSVYAMGAVPTPHPLTIPSYKGGFVVGVGAHYLQPSVSGDFYDYAATATAAPVVNTTYNVDPDYDWGYHLMVGYNFAGTGNDVRLTWDSFNEDDTDSTANPAGGTVTHQIGNAFAGVERATADNDVDAVNLMFGQAINVGSRLGMHFAGGLAYASVCTEVTSISTPNAGTLVGGNVNNRAHWESDWDGWGPRFSMSGNYHVGNGFGIVGGLATAFLIGEIDSHVNMQNPIGTVVGNGRLDDTTRVVPNLEGNLGADYAYQFNNGSVFTVEAGWRINHYFNAVDNAVNSGNATPFFNRVGAGQDFNLNGPYVNVQVAV